MTILEKYYGGEVTDDVEKDISEYVTELWNGLELAHARFGEKNGSKGYRLGFLEIALCSAIALFLQGKADRPLHMLLTHFGLTFNEMNHDLQDWIKDIDKDINQ